MQLTGWPLRVGGNHLDETPRPGESPVELTQRLALAKVRGEAVAPLFSGPRSRPAEGSPDPQLALGADTVVVDGDRILGKPASEAEARQTLIGLRGRSHRVVTSIAVLDRQQRLERLDTCVSEVPMREYTNDELEAYLQGGSPLDKAGSYGIQDDDFLPVDLGQMHACFANVMGLPLCHVVRTVRSLGHQPAADVPHACIAHTGYDCPVYSEILERQA